MCRDHLPISKVHQLQHNKVCQIILSLCHLIIKYLISKMPQITNSLYPHRLTLSHRMLHYCNLPDQHPNPFSRPLLLTSNCSHCYSHQFQAHMLHTGSRISHNLYNLELALKGNPSGSQGSHHHITNLSILLHSLSFQLQRHNKIKCQTLRSLVSQSQ